MNEALSAGTGESKVRQYQSDALTISGLAPTLSLDAATLMGHADVVGGLQPSSAIPGAISAKCGTGAACA